MDGLRTDGAATPRLLHVDWTRGAHECTGSHAPRGPLMAIYSHVRQSTRDAGSPQRRESRASVGAPTWGGTSPLATQPLDGYETCQEPRNQTSASVKGSRYRSEE